MVQDDKALLLRLGQHHVEFVIIGGVCGIIAAKEAVGRPRDLEAATQLRAIKERTQAQTDD